MRLCHSSTPTGSHADDARTCSELAVDADIFHEEFDVKNNPLLVRCAQQNSLFVNMMVYTEF
jgi:hypothetical protein